MNCSTFGIDKNDKPYKKARKMLKAEDPVWENRLLRPLVIIDE
jgi:hypothetical protein